MHRAIVEIGIMRYERGCLVLRTLLGYDTTATAVNNCGRRIFKSSRWATWSASTRLLVSEAYLDRGRSKRHPRTLSSPALVSTGVISIAAAFKFLATTRQLRAVPSGRGLFPLTLLAGSLLMLADCEISASCSMWNVSSSGNDWKACRFADGERGE